MPAGEMEGVYSIGTRNRFDMIDNDVIEDPHELIRAAQEKPKKEKEAKIKGRKDIKPIKTAVKTDTSENENTENKRNDRARNDRGRGGRGRGRGGDRGRGGERGRGGGRGRGSSRGGFSPNSPSNQDGFGFDNNNQPSGGFGGKYQPRTDVDGYGSGFGGDGEDRRGGRSGYRGRGGRGGGGRGRGRGGNREFDRRSGSDRSSVKAVDKRDGSGSYNWGTPQDEINAASEEHSGGFAPKENDDAPTDNVEQTQDGETAVEEVKDEGPMEMTFDEYKKKQSETRNKPQFNLRKVEGENKKGMKIVKKPTEAESESSGSLYFPSKSQTETYKTSGRVQEKLNLDFRYSGGDNRHFDSSRRGRGSGQRGRRGGSQPGGRRDDSNAKEAQIALSNDKEFPSL